MQERIIVNTPEEALETILCHDFYVIKITILAGSFSEWLKTGKHELNLNGDILKIGYTSFPFRIIEEITIRYHDTYCLEEKTREELSVKVSAFYLNHFLMEDAQKMLVKFFAEEKIG